MVPECTMPEGAADRAETLLCTFCYEHQSEMDSIAVPHDVKASGKGHLVSEPHHDSGLLSLVIGASLGMEVFDTTLGGWVPIKQPPHAGPGLTATLLVGETLTILTNGQYAPGQHRVFVPSIASLLSSADDLWYQYSLMFMLHPHWNAIISTPVLTTPMTGAYQCPLIDVHMQVLFSTITCYQPMHTSMCKPICIVCIKKAKSTLSDQGKSES